MAKFGRITRDLTREARDGELEPAYGREKTFYPMLKVLARTARKCILIVGDVGVGKSRLIQGLALIASRAKSTDPISAYSFIELEGPALDSPSPQTDEEIRALLDFLKGSPHVILVVDGIFSLLDNQGDPSTPMSDLARAALDGEISCIGTALATEYDNLPGSDGNPASKMEVIRIEPLTEADTLEILQRLRPEFERQHGVAISENALNTAIKLTQRYMPDEKLPGKAITALDDAARRYQLKAVGKENYPELIEAATLQRLGDAVGPYDVMKVIEETASVDINEDSKRLKSALAKTLSANVQGQDDAVFRIANIVVTLQLGGGSPLRPIGHLLLWGPLGVIVKAAETLAAVVSENRGTPAVFDMADYADPGSGKRLTAAMRSSSAPAYVLSRVEHAHPSVFDALLPALKQGIVEEGEAGLDLRNSWVILCADFEPVDGEGPEMTQLRQALKENIKPEILPLFDKVIGFTGSK